MNIGAAIELQKSSGGGAQSVCTSVRACVLVASGEELGWSTLSQCVRARQMERRGLIKLFNSATD